MSSDPAIRAEIIVGPADLELEAAEASAMPRTKLGESALSKTRTRRYTVIPLMRMWHEVGAIECIESL